MAVRPRYILKLPIMWASTKPMRPTPVRAMTHFLPTAVWYRLSGKGAGRGRRLTGATVMSGVSGGPAESAARRATAGRPRPRPGDRGVSGDETTSFVAGPAGGARPG